MTNKPKGPEDDSLVVPLIETCGDNIKNGAETCDPSDLDWDCDGTVDELSDLEVARAATNELVEVPQVDVPCTPQYQGPENWSQAEYAPDYEQGTELPCDRKDNDCNGLPDNNAVTVGETKCHKVGLFASETEPSAFAIADETAQSCNIVLTDDGEPTPSGSPDENERWHFPIIKFGIGGKF